jgi:NAD(P)H-hydrate epimerase
MSIPVISVQQMREWESASWNAGKSEEAVIQTVGRILAQRILTLTRPGDLVLLLAGRGHNGDDARAAQPHLSERQTALINVTDPKEALQEFLNITGQDRGAANPALHAGGLALSVKRDASRRVPYHLIVDALFGIGLNRPLDEDWQKLIEAINRSGIPILAVDVPSGLNAETGNAEGAAIRAAMTLTVGAPKIGLLATKATPFVGRLEVAPEIGLIPCPESSELNWTLMDDFQNFPPPRPVAAHKGDFGHAIIFAGSLGYHGAAVLAARGALRAQPGLVSLFTQETVYLPVASQLQAAMVHPWKAGKPLPKTCTALLFGPGLAAEDLSENFKSEMRTLWHTSTLPIIVDASALDWLRPSPISQQLLRIITPHPGEAARMLNTTPDKVQADRSTALRDLSRRFGNCFVVLKGHQTLVGRNGGEIFVNSTGNPYLAQGGSGDVLAGYLAGLMAQPPLQADPLKITRYAVWAHGAAADRLSQRNVNWTVEELTKELGGGLT